MTTLAKHIIVPGVENHPLMFGKSMYDFVGKLLAFLLVQNYVFNTWGKFGFQRFMRDEDDVFYFKFTSVTRLEQVKFHKVLVVAYSKDGLSLIVTQIRKPILLDAFTSSMCKTPWGRIGDCHVFGHTFEQCPKRIKEMPKPMKEVHNDGFKTVVNRKSKGTPVANSQKRTFGGVKDQEDSTSEAAVNETNGGNEGYDIFGNPNQSVVLNKVDSDSEVEETLIVEGPTGSKTKGQALPLRMFPMFSITAWNVRGLNRTPKQSESVPRCSSTGSGLLLLICVLRVVVSFLVGTWTWRLLWAELGLHKLVVKGCPWTFLGDFNVALNLEDTFSGSSSLNSAMIEFKDCVADNEVMDINCSGLHFTWNQKPKSGGGILKKLDRIMGNIVFIDTFLGAHAYFQPYRILDHSHLMLKIPDLPINKPKPFKFFNFLTHKTLKKPLRKLVYDHGNLHKRVNKLRHELDEAEKALDLCPTDQTLQVEDPNSAYFHKSLKSRNQRSHIETIRTMNNVQISGPSVPEAFVNHYKMFLGTDMTCDDLNYDGLFSCLVSDQSRDNMVRNVTDVEIKAAMFSIGDDRALGSDGYTFAFFKKGWDIVGQDMCKAVYDFLQMVVSDNQSAFVLDDLFIFARGDVESARVIMESLDEFKHVSGRIPSLPKKRDKIAEATLLSLTLHKVALAAKAQENVAKVKEKFAEEEIEKMVRGKEDEESYASEFVDFMLNDDVDDFGTRIEPGSHKKNPKVVDDDVNDKDKQYKKKDDDDKTKKTSIPKPNRSSRKDLSSYKTISKELKTTVSPTMLPHPKPKAREDLHSTRQRFFQEALPACAGDVVKFATI
uniref:RNA-directed DNA polymerase, eukaryota, reverse transcriptase zinc-binding domain protein n=1 Tax=Tanacetum cinerariifolium TaxID=118510 RepID=A0A6L2P0P8_TANCI|nr:hypothetical protein [Tanacetum cinerariifolium]